MKVYFFKPEKFSGIVVEEKDGGFETPYGFFKVPLSNVLDFLCDVGCDCVYVSSSKSFSSKSFEEGKKAWIEWETPNSIVKKLKLSERSRICGAIALFVGFVREINDGRKVIYLEYERHEELYRKKLRELREKILSYPGVEDIAIFHKTGRVPAGEDIVYVAVMGISRKDVWRALEDAVEGIKKELPIWKKEVFEGGEFWI